MAPKRPATAPMPPKLLKRVRRSEESTHAVPDKTEIVDLTTVSEEDKVTIDLTQDDPPTSSPTVFRFVDLPAEIRLEIYRVLLPHGLRICCVGTPRKTMVAPVGTPDVDIGVGYEVVVPGMRMDRRRRPHYDVFPETCTNIFRVNKLISNEAKGVLYGENTYIFDIKGVPPASGPSLQSIEIFGPFSQPLARHLIRELRSIELHVLVDDHSHWGVKRHRGRIEYFINILKQHADDADQRSLLEHLKVKFHMSYRHTYNRPVTPQEQMSHARCHLFGLESLAQLHGIQNVQIEGQVPEWLKRCLILCVKGEGGPIQPLHYPDVQRRVAVRNSAYVKRYKRVVRTTRTWRDPTLNWAEFAARNGIDMPADLPWFY